MDNQQEKTEQDTWQEWLDGKETELEYKQRRLRGFLDDAYANEEKARIKFCRARDNADSLRYKMEEKKVELKYAKREYEEFMEENEGRG